ncbi:hypothetical protein PAPHI01_2808, partial [Pancytospora philotis]
ALLARLFANLQDRTLIMIVHGKEYLPQFDRLFFLNRGALEATGSYDELLATSEAFRDFISPAERTNCPA